MNLCHQVKNGAPNNLFTKLGTIRRKCPSLFSSSKKTFQIQSRGNFSTIVFCNASCLLKKSQYLNHLHNRTICFSPSLHNHYKTLGVPVEASPKDIKQAFYDLSKKCHPDLHQNNKEKEKEFKTISVAYEVLSDVEQRTVYDIEMRFGVGNTQRPPGYGHGFSSHPAAASRKSRYAQTTTGTQQNTWRTKRGKVWKEPDDSNEEWIRDQHGRMKQRMEREEKQFYKEWEETGKIHGKFSNERKSHQSQAEKDFEAKVKSDSRSSSDKSNNIIARWWVVVPFLMAVGASYIYQQLPNLDNTSKTRDAEMMQEVLRQIEEQKSKKEEDQLKMENEEQMEREQRVAENKRRKAEKKEKERMKKKKQRMEEEKEETTNGLKPVMEAETANPGASVSENDDQVLTGDNVISTELSTASDSENDDPVLNEDKVNSTELKKQEAQHVLVKSGVRTQMVFVDGSLQILEAPLNS